MDKKKKKIGRQCEVQEQNIKDEERERKKKTKREMIKLIRAVRVS